MKGDARLLWEAFSMSNRVALLWALPFGAAAVLFAGDLVEYVLGERWSLAIVLIQVLGAAAAVNQAGFNWTAFFRAVGRTRPIAVADLVFLAAVLAIAIPLMLSDGLDAYAWGWAAATGLFVAVRLAYLAGIFPARRLLADCARAAVPTVPAVAAVLLARLAGGGDSALRAALELALFAGVAAAVTIVWERELLRRAVALLRRPPAPARPAPPR